jgi:hypothetical protein
MYRWIVRLATRMLSLKLPTDPLGAPEPVLAGHGLDDGDRVGTDPRRRYRTFGFATPEELEGLSVPAQDCLGLDEERGVVPGRCKTSEEHEQGAIRQGEPWAHDLPAGDLELLAQERILVGQGRRRTELVQHVSKDGSGRRARPSAGPVAQRGDGRGKAGHQAHGHHGVLGPSRTRVNRPDERRIPRMSEPDGCGRHYGSESQDLAIRAAKP